MELISIAIVIFIIITIKNYVMKLNMKSFEDKLNKEFDEEYEDHYSAVEGEGYRLELLKKLNKR
jgi:hypothetical protein